MRENGARAVRSRRGHRAHLARVGAVKRSTVVRWGLAGGRVLPVKTSGVPRWHRAGGVEAGLTLAVARRAGPE
jgi:hypothetical protein